MNDDNNVKSDISKVDQFEKLSKILSLVAIPLILGFGGWSVQHAITTQSVNQEYVQLAVSILTEPEGQVAPSLREWAVMLLNDNSPTRMDPSVIRDLSSGNVRLPGQVIGRGGIPFDEDFVENLFRNWNEQDQLSLEFRALLTEFADDIIQHRWHKAATFFDPEYYNNQVTFLSGSRREVELVMKQFVGEAFLGIGMVENLDRIAAIRYLGTEASEFNDEIRYLNASFILTDGQQLGIQLMYFRDSYFFIGGVG